MNSVSIPVLRPFLPPADALKPYLSQIDETRHYTNFGPLVLRLENSLAQLLCADSAVCVSSGTMGLELSLAALELPQKSLIALPALNFPASAHAVLNNGHRTLWCDVDKVTGLMHAEHVKSAIGGRRLGAIMPSSINGCSYPAGYWEEVSSDMGVPVILDAAGGIGFQPPASRVITVYSLHATKPLSSAEGGVVVSNNSNFIEAVRSRSNFGFADDMATVRGTNGKMSEYHGAVGLASLDVWEKTKDALHQLFDQYQSAFCAPTMRCRIVNNSGVSSQLAVSVENCELEKLRGMLLNAGIETRTWYVPTLNHHSAFLSLTDDKGLEATKDFSAKLLHLPYGPHVNDTHVSIIAEICGEITQ